MASSSAGNSTFIATENTRVLVDVGLSRREIIRRLNEIGECASRLDAVLITHEHTDHICGLVSLLRRFKIPVYLTPLAAPTITWGDLQPRIEHFQAGSRFTIGDFEVQSFTIPHDSVDPVGFTLRSYGAKVGVVTDLGYMPHSIHVHLRHTDLLVLESNHDLDMLKVGPYPWSVKQRVMGRRGHLSNDVVCEYILESMDRDLQTLVLGHLSEHNNHPEIVRLGAARALQRRGSDARLVVANQRDRSEVFELAANARRAAVGMNFLLPF
ncbi:MAG TPA: MBL fold metallo-hydrolase [Bryobacteraceae bacterium]|nr:MBL fold metallo-hydrolase [Bryobacteraceae bacterium]